MLSKSDSQESEEYLFYSQSGDIAFVAIEEEMAVVNDLLCLLQDGIAEELKRLSRELEGVKNGTIAIADPEGIGVTALYQESLINFQLPHWDYINGRLSTGANLVIIFAFIEWALKWLCGELYDRNYRAVERKINAFLNIRGKIEKYLKFLSDVGDFDFEIPEQFLSLLKAERKIRNSFAHGDWNAFYSLDSSQNLKDVFLSFTHLLEGIEEAWNQPTNIQK